MKGQLVKRIDRWDLYLDDGSKGASTYENHMDKLSLQNCEAIENGYDLDELVKERNYRGFGTDIFNTGFIEGAEAIIKILGDKKFSEDALYDSIMLGVAFEDTGIKGVNNYSELKEIAVRRNTQNEWDVEIVAEFIEEEKTGTDLAWGRLIPKLDENGCLILRRS